MRRGTSPFVFALAVGVLQTAALAEVADVPARFRPTVACMVKVLNQYPRFTDVSAGIQDAQIYVRYSTYGRHGQAGTIQFDAPAADEKLSFEVNLGGLFSPGDKGPEDWGSSKVVDRWKRTCGVDVLVLFV